MRFSYEINFQDAGHVARVVFQLRSVQGDRPAAADPSCVKIANAIERDYAAAVAWEAAAPERDRQRAEAAAKRNSKPLTQRQAEELWSYRRGVILHGGRGGGAVERMRADLADRGFIKLSERGYPTRELTAAGYAKLEEYEGKVRSPINPAQGYYTRTV